MASAKEKPDRHTELRAAAVSVLRTLRDNGHTAYLAGGCVRDEILGLAPTDYDIATDATPERVQRLFENTNAVGAAFGVVLVREGRTTTEVATFRTDGPYTDSRRPDHVTFASPEADAERRDFTINALFLDPLEPDPKKQIIDFVRGREDLARGIIRAVGDADRRFGEDDLRALRAVRFACRYAFEIEQGTRAAITKHAPGLGGVSRERIGIEIRKMLTHESRSRAVGLMQELRIDGTVLDADSRDAELRVLRAVDRDASPIAAMLAWGIDRAGTWPTPISAADFRRALMLSNDETAALSAATNNLAAMTREEHPWEQLAVAKRKRLATEPGSAEARCVHAAIDPENAARIEADIQSLEADGVGLEPEPLLNGDHLIAAGFTPGPGFGALLAAVYDAQLEGALTDIAGAQALASTLADRHHVHRLV